MNTAPAEDCCHRAVRAGNTSWFTHQLILVQGLERDPQSGPVAIPAPKDKYSDPYTLLVTILNNYQID